MPDSIQPRSSMYISDRTEHSQSLRMTARRRLEWLSGPPDRLRGRLDLTEKPVLRDGGSRLSRFASKVVLLVRKDHMRAQKSLQQKLQDADNVELRYNTRILSLAGDELPSSITIQNTANGETYKETYDEGSFGVFVFVGMQPQNDAVAELVQLDASGHIITDELMQTSTTGLYAAGDCRAKYLRQIVTATSDGAIAASRAAEYLTSL